MAENPRKRNHRKEETLEVVCRIKKSYEPHQCVVAQDEEHVRLIPPNTLNRNNAVQVEKVYRFGHVFDCDDSQKEVFNRCAVDLIEDLVKGKNSLLFAYGVTSSGKTFTMTGENNDMNGILPRTADVLFNSIPELVDKCVFYPDGKNGFKIRSKFEANEERGKLPFYDNEIFNRAKDFKKVEGFSRGMAASVFISYVEIYNDNCYDLFDEALSSDLRTNMSKKVVQDGNNVFVEKINEVEVQSSDEIIGQYKRAQERRKIAKTLLNASSSRSHSVFNIRLVMAPGVERYDIFEKVQPVADESKIIISQMSMVDLAGSERTKRTNNNGDRLFEAGKINNSLLSLRRCFELLRENQRRRVPCASMTYRDCKLIHLFKNFFEGAGRIRMIVCVNPEPSNYDENLTVMQFAELAQTVDIPEAEAPLLPLANVANLPYGRRDIIRWYKEVEHVLMPVMPMIEFFDPPPPIQLNGPDDLESISKLRDYYSNRLAKHRGHLATINTNASLLQNKITQRLCIADLDRARVQELEADADELNSYNATTNAKLTQAQREINALKQRLYRYENTEQNGRRRDEEARAREREMQMAAEQQRIKLQKVVEIFESPVPSTSRVATLRKQFVSTENLDGENSTPKMSSRQLSKQRGPPGSAQPQSSVQFAATNTTGAIAALGFSSAKAVVTTGYANPRFQHRRSRSQGALRTLNHQAVNKIPTGTLLQPQFPKNTKHTTKVEASDLQKCHEYVTSKQKVDEHGNLSTEYLKGEIVPTAGGGSAVMFRDVEKLCQESPKHIELNYYR